MRILRATQAVPVSGHRYPATPGPRKITPRYVGTLSSGGPCDFDRPGRTAANAAAACLSFRLAVVVFAELPTAFRNPPQLGRLEFGEAFGVSLLLLREIFSGKG